MPWWHWAPVALLLIAVASQAVLMATVNEDRQAGSGFAMFSSVDFVGSRALVIRAVANGADISVKPPARFDERIETLTTSPTHERAERLAQDLEQLAWSVDAGVATESGTTTIDQVQVTVRGLTADGRTLKSQVLAQSDDQQSDDR